MGLIRRTPTSGRDYQAIWDDVAEHGSPDAGDPLLRTLDDRVQFLSDRPGAVPARPVLRPRLRSFPVGSYVLFCRRARRGIELVRVLHGARDLQPVFGR